jgi:alpha-galactosidase
MDESLEGHAAHVKRADGRGLAGEMPRPVKVTIIGAGSMFSSEISNDLLRIPGSAGGTIALVDVDGERLDLMRRVL